VTARPVFGSGEEFLAFLDESMKPARRRGQDQTRA